ncbi:MAG: hypothetical protein WEF51_00545 [Chloroflexota bacterium]
MRTVLFALLLAALATGCTTLTGTPPAPTPADFPGIAAALARRGIAVSRIVSGDPGCDDANLVPAAIRFEASGLDQQAPTRAYIYIFRNRAAFDRLLPDVARCAGAFNTDEDREPWIALSPFVLTGPGPWPSAFRDAMADGLTEAAGTGG